MAAPAPGSFAPKQPVKLDAPKDTPISSESLRQYDGSDPSKPTYVAIKGKVFDVSGNSSYATGGTYHVFAGKDASRALALSSLKAEDAIPNYSDLDAKAQKTLDDWFSFFSQRYNIVGTVSSISNL